MTAASIIGPRGAPDWAARGGMTLDRLAVGMFVLLAIEFLLGMALALFTTLPSGASVVSVLSSTPTLIAHIVVAVLIVGISLRALTLSTHALVARARSASAIALGSALVATVAGWEFAFEGQSPYASFAMAVGFLGVLLGAFLLRGATPRSIPAPQEQP